MLTEKLKVDEGHYTHFLFQSMKNLITTITEDLRAQYLLTASTDKEKRESHFMYLSCYLGNQLTYWVCYSPRKKN